MKRFLLKIGYYNLKDKILDWFLIKSGYISDDYESLKCTCGCMDLEDCNQDYLDEYYRGTVLEYDCKCSECGRILGH